MSGCSATGEPEESPQYHMPVGGRSFMSWDAEISRVEYIRSCVSRCSRWLPAALSAM